MKRDKDEEFSEGVSQYDMQKVQAKCAVHKFYGSSFQRTFHEV